MSTIIHPAQFHGPGIKPLDPTNQAQMDLALQLALSVMLPRVPHVSGATIDDCEAAVEAIERVTKLYVEFCDQVISNLNENLPVTDTIDLKSFGELIADVKNDAVGLVQVAGDRINDDV
jgi:hypothetical protein